MKNFILETLKKCLKTLESFERFKISDGEPVIKDLQHVIEILEKELK